MLKFREFCVRTVIKADAPVTSRQNLVKSSTKPIAIFLSPIVLLGLTTASACVTPTDVDTHEAVSAIEE
jgi:hypothetical protein